MRSEPKNVYLICLHKRDKIIEYNVTVAEWSDETYTVLASKPTPTGLSDIIVSHEFEFSWYEFPSDEEIAQIIEERLAERLEAYEEWSERSPE